MLDFRGKIAKKTCSHTRAPRPEKINLQLYNVVKPIHSSSSMQKNAFGIPIQTRPDQTYPIMKSLMHTSFEFQASKPFSVYRSSLKSAPAFILPCHYPLPPKSPHYGENMKWALLQCKCFPSQTHVVFLKLPRQWYKKFRIKASQAQSP